MKRGVDQIDWAAEYTGKQMIRTRLEVVAKELDVPFLHALGIAECLFHYAKEHLRKGNIGKISNDSLALAVDWQGDPDALINALLAAGLLTPHTDHRLTFHRWPTRCWYTYPEKTRRRLEHAAAAGGEVSRSMRRAVIADAGGLCLQCGSTHKLTADHIVPISRGGKTVRENLQCLCQRCNSSKGAKLMGINQ